MLGYVTATGQGAADRLIREVAFRLKDDGMRLAGAVQVNLEHDPAQKCHMDLHILSGTDVVRISQNLGALSQGCRLDPNGLEQAAGLVSAALANGAELLVVNKFGKQEAEGRGFRPLIGEALSQGVPVLTAVGRGNLEAFQSFAQDLAVPLTADADVITAWCRSHRAAA